MRTLLGKITAITENEDKSSGKFRISFKAVCIMPDRAAAPEWLKDQVLTIDRDLVDTRELGRPGDSIVLMTSESERWLYPLVVEPNLVYGNLPETIRVLLRWWKDENPPGFTVNANGRLVTGKLVKQGDEYSAEVKTDIFFDIEPHLPTSFKVTCEKLEVACSVLPVNEPFCYKLVQPQGEMHRLENDWYAVDIDANTNAAGIVSLKEKGRRIDHFHTPQDLIQTPFEYVGHIDRLAFGQPWGEWGNKLDEVTLTSSGGRREGRTTRTQFDGIVDEGLNLRTSISYTLHDNIPFLSLQRDYFFHPVKKKQEGDEKKQKPKEPIDDLNAVRLGFRGAWMADRDTCNNSRLLFVEGERLASIRLVQTGEYAHTRNWRISQGWMIIENPLRREYTMYLFDPRPVPRLMSYLDSVSVFVESWWPGAIAAPGDSLGRCIGMSVGEVCGVSTDGAWIACRAIYGDSVRCAIIARMREGSRDSTAIFRLGDKTHDTQLQEVFLPGIGLVQYAVVEIANASMDDKLEVAAAGIAGRREP